MQQRRQRLRAPEKAGPARRRHALAPRRSARPSTRTQCMAHPGAPSPAGKVPHGKSGRTAKRLLALSRVFDSGGSSVTGVNRLTLCFKFNRTFLRRLGKETQLPLRWRGPFLGGFCLTHAQFASFQGVFEHPLQKRSAQFSKKVSMTRIPDLVSAKAKACSDGGKSPKFRMVSGVLCDSTRVNTQALWWLWDEESSNLQRCWNGA